MGWTYPQGFCCYIDTPTDQQFIMGNLEKNNTYKLRI